MVQAAVVEALFFQRGITTEREYGEIQTVSGSFSERIMLNTMPVLFFVISYCFSLFMGLLNESCACIPGFYNCLIKSVYISCVKY